MHELTLAHEICRIVEAQVEPDDLPAVRVVGLEIGDDANVELSALAFCLEVVLSQPPFGRAEAAITRVSGDDMRVTFLEVDDGDPDD